MSTCAVLKDGGAACWGGPRDGSIPERIPGLTNAVDVVEAWAIFGVTQKGVVVSGPTRYDEPKPASGLGAALAVAGNP